MLRRIAAMHKGDGVDRGQGHSGYPPERPGPSEFGFRFKINAAENCGDLHLIPVTEAMRPSFGRPTRTARRLIAPVSNQRPRGALVPKVPVGSRSLFTGSPPCVHNLLRYLGGSSARCRSSLRSPAVARAPPRRYIARYRDVAGYQDIAAHQARIRGCAAWTTRCASTRGSSDLWTLFNPCEDALAFAHHWGCSGTGGIDSRIFSTGGRQPGRCRDQVIAALADLKTRHSCTDHFLRRSCAAGKGAESTTQTPFKLVRNGPLHKELTEIYRTLPARRCESREPAGRMRALPAESPIAEKPSSRTDRPPGGPQRARGAPSFENACRSPGSPKDEPRPITTMPRELVLQNNILDLERRSVRGRGRHGVWWCC